MDRPLHVIMDPRVDATPEALDRQFALADSIYAQTLSSRKAMAELDSVETQLMKLDSISLNNPPDLTQAIHSALAKLREIKGGDDEDAEKSKSEIALAKANAGLVTVLHVVESGHRAAPAQVLEILSEMSAAARKRYTVVATIQNYAQLTKVNAALVHANRKPLQIAGDRGASALRHDKVREHRIAYGRALFKTDSAALRHPAACDSVSEKRDPSAWLRTGLGAAISAIGRRKRAIIYLTE